MSNLSPNNKIINSINRSRYIEKLRGNIGAIKENNRTPIHHKLFDTYDDIKSNISSRYVIVFVLLLIITLIILYYFKPSFVLKQNIEIQQLKISSNKQNKLNKVVSYWKLFSYSLLITIVIYTILYFMRTKSEYIAKIFESSE
jgi:hypothetical protein